MGEEDTEAETMSEEKMLSFILKMLLQHPPTSRSITPTHLYTGMKLTSGQLVFLAVEELGNMSMLNI